MQITIGHSSYSSKLLIGAIVLLLAMSASSLSFAQGNSIMGNIIPDGKGHHWKKTAFKPKMILVQLRSEKNKTDYFLQNKKYLAANRVRREASIVRKVMKNDFEENFSFCPVYYFIDTNAGLIKKQKFDDVLFTAEGIPMKHGMLKPGDTNYLIVYYGYPEDQMALNDDPNENSIGIGNGEVMGKGLIFLNYRYRQLDFYYRFSYYDFFDKPSQRYAYRSAEYDMEYYPFAAEYEMDLQEKYNNVIVSRKLPRY